MIALTPKQWVALAFVVVLFGAGWYIRDSAAKRADFKNVKAQFNTLQKQGEAYDKAVADKMREDALIDSGVGKAQNKNQEAARHDPSYRSYLDRPLPDASLRLYRDAAAAIAAAQHPGTDDSSAAPDQGDH